MSLCLHASGRGQSSRSSLRAVASACARAHRRSSPSRPAQRASKSGESCPWPLVLAAILLSLSCATETAAMPVSDTQSVSSSSGMTLRDERLTRPSTGSIDRALLTPRFDTYRLPESPMMVLEATAHVPGGGLRTTSEQIGGGVDYASTAFRVRFNDLQPDRTDPQGSFYIVTRDGSLHQVSVGTSSLDLSSPFPLLPTLTPGEIVSVVASGPLVVVCRQGGRLALLRRTRPPTGTMVTQAEMLLSNHGSTCDAVDPSDDRLDAGIPEEAAWWTHYHVLDVCFQEGIGGAPTSATILLAVMSKHGPTADASVVEAQRAIRAGEERRGGRNGLRAAAKLQVLELELASGDGGGGRGWRTVRSTGLEIGGVLPRIARLWGSGRSIVLVSPHTPEPTSAALQGPPTLGAAGEDGFADDDEDVDERGVVLSRAVWTGEEWECDTRPLADSAHGNLEWIASGGPSVEQQGLPMLGLLGRGGAGVHDMHAFQLCGAGGSAFPENGSKDAPEAVHRASFSGIAYIQKSKEALKDVTFDADVTQSVVVESTETCNVYARNRPGRRTAPQCLLQVGAEGAVVAGFAALPNALLTLTPTFLALHRSPPRDEEDDSAPGEDVDSDETGRQTTIPEHLLDDW